MAQSKLAVPQRQIKNLTRHAARARLHITTTFDSLSMNRSAAVPSRSTHDGVATPKTPGPFPVRTCCGWDSRAPVRPRFMVPMHAQTRKEASHELPCYPLPPHPVGRGWPKAG